MALGAKAGLLSLPLLLFAFGARPAQGEWVSLTAFEVGPWRGEASFEDQAFRDCRVVRRYGETDLIVTMGRSGALGMSLKNGNWDLGNGSRYDIRLKVDRRFERDVTGVGVGSLLVLLDRGGSKLFQSLRAGRTLIVESSDQTLTFPLNQSSLALGKLPGCIDEHGRQEANPRNPFGSPVEESGIGPEWLRRPARRVGEIDGFGPRLRRMLNASGLDDVEIGFGEDAPEAALATWSAPSRHLVGFHFGWRSWLAIGEAMSFVLDVRDRCDRVVSQRFDKDFRALEGFSVWTAEVICESQGNNFLFIHWPSRRLMNLVMHASTPDQRRELAQINAHMMQELARLADP